jgi:hypothetical protein
VTATDVTSRAISTAFGLVMIAASAIQADGPALAVVLGAAVAVLAGNVFRPVATLAVLLTVCAVMIAGAPPVVAAVSGLSAAAYLVLRHTGAITAPTVAGAAAFAAAGLAATALPVRLPWAPLLAPMAVLVLFVLATRPYWSDRSSG